MPHLAVNCALGVWAAAAAGADLWCRRVPNLLLWILLVPALITLAWSGRGLLGASALHSGLGLLAAGLPLLPGYALGQLGAGDVKLSGSLGLLLGSSGAVEMLLVACVLLGGVCGVVLAVRRGRADRGSVRIPVAPAFAAAFALQLAFGRMLV